MSEWKKVKLGDCCDITSSKRIFFSEYVDMGIPFYRSKEIIELSNGQSISEPLYISETKYNDIRMKFGVPKENDILLTSVGSIGIPYIVKKDDVFYFKDGNLTWLRNYKDYVSPPYLLYWLKSEEAFNILNNIALGAAQKALTIFKLKNIEIPLPLITTQQHIVDILSRYDSLIENYQKQIKLLEEAAQRLYKEWFVDLRFPGHENTKIVDGVPEGWTKSSLEEICSVSKKVISPSNMEKGRPYIGLEHMPRKDFCLSVWGKSEDISSSKYEYKENDILFGKIRPYFHKVGFAINNGYASTDSIIMQPKLGLWGLLLMTVYSDRFVKNTSQACKEGAKMPRADWNQMKKYPILIASDNVQYTFERSIKITANRIKEVATQIRLLTEARDCLLPKLMSGEIEV